MTRHITMPSLNSFFSETCESNPDATLGSVEEKLNSLDWRIPGNLHGQRTHQLKTEFDALLSRHGRSQRLDEFDSEPGLPERGSSGTRG